MGCPARNVSVRSGGQECPPYILLRGGSYTIYDAPNSQGTTFTGINNNGDIVGYFNGAAGYNGLSLIHGVFTQIDVPGSEGGTTADGINDSGDIVGRADILETAYILKNNVFHRVAIRNASDTDALGVNNADMIVGHYTDASGRGHGYAVIP